MRILHVIYSLCTGGAETMLIDIANHQSSKHTVGILIVNNRINEDLIATINKKVNIIRINRIEGSKNILNLIKLNIRVLQFNPNVIHCHNHSLINILFTYHRKLLTVHDVGIGTSNLHRYNKIFAISKAVYNDINFRNNICTTVVENGIELNNIKTKVSFRKLPLTVLSVSRLNHEKKGQDILIKAIASIKRQYGIALELTLIGEGDSINFLKELVHQEEIKSQVHFLGLQNRAYIYEHICDYDIFVQPSRFEGFGLTVAEAIAARIPVLVSDNDGPMEIINYGQYGQHFKVNEIDDCATKLMEMYINYTHYVKLTKDAYKHVVNNYSITATAANYIHHYQNATY